MLIASAHRALGVLYSSSIVLASVISVRFFISTTLSLLLIKLRVVADHDGVVPGCPGEDTMVTDVVLDVADDGTLRDPVER